MSAISLKSITGITSITTPAGVDNQLTLHNNNTSEAVKIDVAGNVHVNNHLAVAGVTTFSGDVVFSGNGTDITFDKSSDDLIFNDGAKAIFGTSSDGIQLYHSGSHSYIDDTGTGNLYIRNGTKNSIWCQTNGHVNLYHNDNRRLQTTDDGISVDKGVTINGIEGGDAQIRLRADEGDDNNDMFRFVVSDGGTGLKIQGYDGSFQTRLTIASDGTTTVAQNLDVGAGLDVTGNITATGSVTISSAAPNLLFTETDANPDWGILCSAGQMKFQDMTATANILTLDSNKIQAVRNLDAMAGVDVTGNITATGEIKTLTLFESTSGNDLRLNAGSANRDIFLQVNDATLMTVRGSTGKVGIGTNIPSTGKLEVQDDGNIKLLTLKRTTGNSGEFSVTIGGADPGTIFDAIGVSNDFIFRPGGNEKVRIESGGGLKFTGQGTSIPVGGILHHTNNNLYVRGGTSGLVLGNQDNTNTIHVSDSNFIKFETNDGTEKLRITSDGNVTMGDPDSSSSSALHIRSNTSTETTLELSTKGNYNGSLPSAKISFTQQNGTEIARIKCDTHTGAANMADLVFWTNYGGLYERMRITRLGKVGIGTDNPVTNLDVRGSSDASITIGLNNGTKYGNFSCDNSATYLYAYNGNDIIFSTHSGNSFNRKVTIKNDGKVGMQVATPKSNLHVYGPGDIRIGSQYGGHASIAQQVQYSSGYTGVHWMFETNGQMSWCFDGVMIVHGSGGSSYGTEVTHIKLVYSRESGALDSGDTWRNGSSDYNIETLGHGQVGLAPSSGSFSYAEQTNPDGSSSTRSLFKLSWSASGQSVGVWSKLVGNFYWGSGTSGNVEIQDKDGNIVFNSI